MEFLPAPTTQDLERDEMSPSQIPMDYNGLVALLHCNLLLLRVLFEKTDVVTDVGLISVRKVRIQSRLKI
jgi:hypothetical protein